ncbi:MAG TPA: T9SS type A sorting domain-containing protein, partial [Bacteroidota bacterium]|nr:T9SS type A sorting domain-containing protein [Bacteroidota bacterium]
AGPHGSISPAGVVSVAYDSAQAFSITPEVGYAVDSLVVDGSYAGAPTSYTFSHVTAAHSIAVTFKVAAAYNVSYRSFTYPELIVKTSLKKKAVHSLWEFKIKNSSVTTLSEINIQFKNDVLQIISSGSLVPSGSKKLWKFSGLFAANDSVVIRGQCVKAMPQQIKKLWLGPGTTKVPTITILPSYQLIQLPMPNLANVREDAYKRGALGPTGFIVGKVTPLVADYGWVRMKKANDMYNSLIYKNVTHTGAAHGFDKFDNTKKFVKEQSSLSPVKQNNKLFADLLTLKFNIALSARGITQPGFGELQLALPGNPFDTWLVKAIANQGDQVMTFYRIDSNYYKGLDTTIVKINEAFSGAMDTTNWSDSLEIKGVRPLIDVSYLQSSGVMPERIQPDAVVAEQVPEGFSLQQNYPNPFNPSTTIEFTLSMPAVVTLKVYDILGREVATLLDNAQLEDGDQEVQFNALNLATGPYFYRITANGRDEEGNLRSFTSVKKMMLMK